MATRFYLNDCLPQQCVQGNVFDGFRNLVITFKELRGKEALNIERFWTLADYSSNLCICQVSLKNLINSNSDPTIKAYMWKLVGENIPISFAETSLESNPRIGFRCTFNMRNAHNLLVAKEADMIAASISVEPNLEKDKLQLLLDDGNGNISTSELDNLYAGNAAYIEKILTPPLPPVEQPLERLKVMFGLEKSVHVSDEFLLKWNSLGLEMQKYIVGKFDDALKADLLFPARDDDGKVFPLIKRDQVDSTSRVHELRIKGFGGVRIYLECDEKTLYIGLYNVKGRYSGDAQSADFRRAKILIARMRQGLNCAF